MTIPPEPKNCCCCPTIVPRWLNTTVVRPDGDSGTPGAPHYTSAPYPRNADTRAAAVQNWLQAADLLGPSAHVIDAAIKDIQDCPPPDSSFTTPDHNCYASSGTVDLSVPHKIGGKWLLVKKSWHGSRGFLDDNQAIVGTQTTDENSVAPDGTGYIPTYSYAFTTPFVTVAPQTRYLTRSITTGSLSYKITPTGDGDYVDNAASITGAVNVNKNTGILTHSLASSGHVRSYTISGGSIVSDDDLVVSNGAGTHTVSNTGYPTTVQTYLSGLTTLIDQLAGTDLNGGLPVFNTPHDYIDVNGLDLLGLIEWFNGFQPGPPANFLPFSEVTDWNSFSGTAKANLDQPAPTVLTISWQRTATSFTFSVDYNDGGNSLVGGTITFSYSGTISLTNPYTSTNVIADWQAARAWWNLADPNGDNVYPFREDEQLANMPVVCYDELFPVTADGFLTVLMDDYNAGLTTDPNGVAPGGSGYLTTWTPRAWVDPNNYLWLWPDNTYTNAGAATSGATLQTPLYGGSIISHNPAGCDRHFWFKYQSFTREWVDSVGGYEWFAANNGDYSNRHSDLDDGNLPTATLRFQNRQESQYDALALTDAATPPVGNYPQRWLHESGAVLVGADYVEAKEAWNSVNYARPCAADKFAVDNTTVCYIRSGTGAGGSLVVDKTANAIAPSATGGLQIGDPLIIAGEGVFPISNITGTGPWTIAVGTILDTLPTGYAIADGIISGYCGRARFWTAPGIAGRVAISTAFASGTLTITPGTAQLYLRTGETIDLCDASMAVLATVAITRVGDSTFTAATGAAIPTAVWMVVHGATSYVWNTTASRGDYVTLEWQFNPRANNALYPSPPTFYDGVGGCLSLTVTQLTAPGPTCGASRVSPPAFPATLNFDDDSELPHFGHWQSAVETAMPDPFWQEPFVPDEGGDLTITWTEDDGTGLPDAAPIMYFAHRPLVEAAKTPPAGAPPLPSGIYLTYDTAHNAIDPYFYPNGIPIDPGTAAEISANAVPGKFASVPRSFGFYAAACANVAGAGRFSAIYASFIPPC